MENEPLALRIEQENCRFRQYLSRFRDALDHTALELLQPKLEGIVREMVNEFTPEVDKT